MIFCRIAIQPCLMYIHPSEPPRYTGLLKPTNKSNQNYCFSCFLFFFCFLFLVGFFSSDIIFELLPPNLVKLWWHSLAGLHLHNSQNLVTDLWCILIIEALEKIWALLVSCHIHDQKADDYLLLNQGAGIWSQICSFKEMG